MFSTAFALVYRAKRLIVGIHMYMMLSTALSRLSLWRMPVTFVVGPLALARLLLEFLPTVVCSVSLRNIINGSWYTGKEKSTYT